MLYSYYKLTVFRRSVGELHDASAVSGGQPSVDKSVTISLIQISLRENRLLHKMRCKIPDTLNLKGSSPVCDTKVHIQTLCACS